MLCNPANLAVILINYFKFPRDLILFLIYIHSHNVHQTFGEAKVELFNCEKFKLILRMETIYKQNFIFSNIEIIVTAGWTCPKLDKGQYHNVMFIHFIK